MKHSSTGGAKPSIGSDTLVKADNVISPAPSSTTTVGN